MSALPDPLRLLQSLIRCPSVTPAEAGALSCLEAVLRPTGFDCHRLVFAEVDNLFARFGTGRPHFCFAGHADVVPPGDDALWSHPPFAAEIADGMVYGRGACDMKGSLAAFAAAAIGFLEERGLEFSGSVSMLVTCDEEGPGVNGTVKVLEWLANNDLVPDHCLVGEPTSTEALGDVMKIGRRGAVQFTVTATGSQGHTAYPQFADNPVPKLARLIDRLASARLDGGTEHFEPSTLAVTSFDVGNPATNVIPASARARFNIRFNSLHTAESLKHWVDRHCEAVAAEVGGRFTVATPRSSECFITEKGPLVEVVSAAVERETKRRPRLSTTGGTSDARYVKNYCPVVEFGPSNATIHQADERIAVAEFESLTRIHRNVLEAYFSRTWS
ncbi:MAG TPA: succinyl-diaminopimelate desuccinylase [Hyphomicrobiales bacterium]|nr:succinyl-diaminopimelate desuccinylase [Hyphomicrobiales bacterium]